MKTVKTHNIPSKICVKNSGVVFNGIKTEEKKQWKQKRLQ